MIRPSTPRAARRAILRAVTPLVQPIYHGAVSDGSLAVAGYRRGMVR